MMEEEEQDDFADIYNATPPPAHHLAADGASNKRKHDDDDYGLEDPDDFYAEKRQKTVSPTNTGYPMPKPPTLPMELWQHVFRYLAPDALAKVLRVDHKLNACLTCTDPATICKVPEGTTRPLPSNDIWRASRQTYYPFLPAASPSYEERVLWRLLRGEDCQFCGRASIESSSPTSPWAAGPGDKAVSIVWPFGVRSCGPCLRQRVQTDSSLMFSDYSALLAAAPFAFMTCTDHVVSPTLLRSGVEAPATAEISKVFFVPMLEDMQSTLQAARQQTPPTAGELYSRLRADRQSKLEAAEAWAQWQAAGGLAMLRTRASKTHTSFSTPDQPMLDNATPVVTAGSQRISEDRSSSPPYSPHLSEASGTKAIKSEEHTPKSSSTPRTATFAFLPRNFSRNANTVREAKTVRHAEIERRCRELDPPITPELLNHMDSFQAAMQIGAALNDNGWNMLKPRLIAQRQVAQEREDERQAAIKALRTDTNIADAQGMDEDRLRDRWDVLQKPIRSRLARYVDEIVRTSWADGTAINYDTSPRFASDALIYVRNRFASDLPKALTNEAPVSKLVLENMKWIFDNKIKPLTDSTRRDLFRCVGCGESSKFYAFDSIIQHYAAKHTSTYSSGNAVVAWHEALWPEQPPFQTYPDPDSRRKGLQTPFPRQPAITSQPPGPLPGPSPIYAPVPGFYGGHMASPPPFGQGYGPYMSPSNPQSSPSHHYPGHQPYHNSGSPAYQHPSGFPPPGPPSHQGATSPFDAHGGFYPSPQTPASVHGGWGAPPFSSHPPTYASSPAQGAPTFLQMQSDAVASIAREVWDSLFIIKQIHPSVRMYVLIHHVVSQFKTRFSNEPNLDLFTQCLINHHLMRPMKDANGLACKTCVVNNESREESHTHAFPLSSGERKLYPFHSLLLHFKNVHVEHALALKNAQTHETAENLDRLDWKEDMIELPPDDIVAGYGKAPGMDRSKYDLLRDAFPDLPEFVEQDVPPLHMRPIPIQAPGHGRHLSAGYPASSPVYAYQPMDISPTTHEPFIKLEPGMLPSGTSNQRYSPSYPDNAPLPRDDEYDPRRPAFIDSRLPPPPAGHSHNTGYQQTFRGGYVDSGVGTYRHTPSRQSYDHQSHAGNASGPTASATDPQLTALLQNLTAHQAAQAQAKSNTVGAGSQRAQDQAEDFLRDFVPSSQPQGYTGPQRPDLMQPPQRTAYPGPPQMYEQTQPPDSHYSQSRRASSISGSYDGRPTYMIPEQQQQYRTQYAQYPEEPVEYVYVRRRDAEQQPFQGYR